MKVSSDSETEPRKMSDPEDGMMSLHSLYSVIEIVITIAVITDEGILERMFLVLERYQTSHPVNNIQ